MWATPASSPCAWTDWGTRPWTGLAIAGGVILEIFLMGHSASMLGNFGVERLLVGAVTWSPLGARDDLHPVAIVAVNTVHGITFGMFWIAGVALMNDRAPDRVATSAQGLLALAVGGIGSSLGILGAAGWRRLGIRR